MQKLKGQLEQLPAAAIGMVVLVIIISMGVLILAGLNNSTDNSIAQGVIGKGMSAMGSFGDWNKTAI